MQTALFLTANQQCPSTEGNMLICCFVNPCFKPQGCRPCSTNRCFLFIRRRV